MRFGVVVLLAACGSGSPDAPPAERHLPTPAERAAAPRSSAQQMSGSGAPAAAARPSDPAASSAPTGSSDPAGVLTAPAGSAAPRFATLLPQWTSVQRDPSCFYFSGPDGRDDQLTGTVRVDRSGDTLTLHIGNTSFTGTYKDGEMFVERHSDHDYLGQWTVTETIHGRYLERQMRAKYHYAECAHDEPCPGHCTIDADLTFVR
jgi:hypothetical protein